ncbi:unnamed protein product [Prorocentrum cordatum]|uniref:N-acetyltransferase domain-containing protein n=1 Tax=Prorocentrum cordatum TaxID=2364126 RepID=A0ABN9X4R7_9DINO|nr:unnamed protein product [Polarella glacialis]
MHRPHGSRPLLADRGPAARRALGIAPRRGARRRAPRRPQRSGPPPPMGLEWRALHACAAGAPAGRAARGSEEGSGGARGRADRRPGRRAAGGLRGVAAAGGRPWPAGSLPEVLRGFSGPLRGALGSRRRGGDAGRGGRGGQQPGELGEQPRRRAARGRCGRGRRGALRPGRGRPLRPPRDHNGRSGRGQRGRVRRAVQRRGAARAAENRGVGRFMVERAEAEACARGFSFLYVWTVDGTEALLRFYQRAGFELAEAPGGAARRRAARGADGRGRAARAPTAGARVVVWLRKALRGEGGQGRGRRGRAARRGRRAAGARPEDPGIGPQSSVTSAAHLHARGLEAVVVLVRVPEASRLPSFGDVLGIPSLECTIVR